jgi:SAM-dependent methyltransferase
MNCRHCGETLSNVFVDLGVQPPSNSYLTHKDEEEKKYPLRVLVCEKCYLVQTEDFVDRAEMFSKEYAYFSSMSKSFLEHSEKYVAMIVDRLRLNWNSKVYEIACNDGYLLQYFKQHEIEPFGIEPTKSTAEKAREKGIVVVEDFFGLGLASRLSKKYGDADLILGNNVLAHVPDINDFLKGVAELLRVDGTVTFEFPHLLNLIRYNQFDTIYHEHYSYLSLTALVKIFDSNGLVLYDVEEISTHGGSLRVYGCLNHVGAHTPRNSVRDVLDKEDEFGLKNIEFYDLFAKQIDATRFDFDLFVNHTKDRKVAGYGAAAKGNTFLNTVGELNNIAMIADTSPLKIGKYMPGSRIPIVSEDSLKEYDPDYVVIFPWNIKESVIDRLLENRIVKDSCKFVTFIPRLEIS